MDIKVSVIVPTHNSEKYIRECVESIMQQTHRNLEILCVDSSKDSTLSILQELAEADSRITIIQDENGSYGHKLNVGIAHATGDYIAIVESDDYILPQMYEQMLENVPEDIDYIKCAVKHFADINGKRVFVVESRGKVEEHLESVIDLERERELALIDLPKIWTALYKKEFLVKNDIWANETPGASYQDTSFTGIVAFLAKKCIYKKEAYYCYRNDNQGSSVKSKEKMFFVCEEYRYLKDKLLRHQKYTEKEKEQLLKRKLISYRWNMMRLPDESYKEFIAGISDEWKEYPEEMRESLVAFEKQFLHVLLDVSAAEIYRKEWKNVIDLWQSVISEMDKDHECVLVGAGNFGKKILWLQDIANKNAICAVADNNFQKMKEPLGRYSVQAVEMVTTEYPNAEYLVANKYHAEEIKSQLMSLGIEPEKILIVDKDIEPLKLLGECIKHYS